MLITLGVNLGLNILLIRRYRHVGSAFSMLASEGMLLVLSTIFISRSISKLEYIGFTWKAIIVSVLMGIGLYFTPFVSVWIRIIGAIGMYFGIMWFWGELRHFSTTRSLVKSQKWVCSYYFIITYSRLWNTSTERQRKKAEISRLISIATHLEIGSNWKCNWLKIHGFSGNLLSDTITDCR